MTNAKKGRLSVLVADDSAAVRSRLTEMCSRIQGVEVVKETEDVPETLASIRARRPEVAILDIEMPGGSGIDVLREVKRDFPETVVVMLTNHAEPQYRKKCIELKADYFLSKPADSSQLIEIITQLAARE